MVRGAWGETSFPSAPSAQTECHSHACVIMVPLWLNLRQKCSIVQYCEEKSLSVYPFSDCPCV